MWLINMMWMQALCTSVPGSSETVRCAWPCILRNSACSDWCPRADQHTSISSSILLFFFKGIISNGEIVEQNSPQLHWSIARRGWSLIYVGEERKAHFKINVLSSDNYLLYWHLVFRDLNCFCGLRALSILSLLLWSLITHVLCSSLLQLKFVFLP